jgi:hypothetical protein
MIDGQTSCEIDGSRFIPPVPMILDRVSMDSWCAGLTPLSPCALIEELSTGQVVMLAQPAMAVFLPRADLVMTRREKAARL